MHWFAALRPCFTLPKPCLAVFCKKRDPLTPVRSKHALAPSIFPSVPAEMCFCYCSRAIFLSARALRPRISHTLSAHACAVQTRFRPSNLGVFFNAFSLKRMGLQRLGSALLHLSHARRISTRKAIRSCLCGPNTLLPLPFVGDCCPNALLCLAQALLCCPLALLCRAKSLLYLVQALHCLPRALLHCAQTLPCLAEPLPCCAQGVLCCLRVLLCFAQALLCWAQGLAAAFKTKSDTTDYVYIYICV